MIGSPTKREIQSVIHFLTARNMSAADIHRQVTKVYDTEAMSDSKVRKWSGSLNVAEQKEKRYAISLDFWICYKVEGNDMLSRIVIGDETWVSHITPESKQQSMEW
ncbi:histone-lysine N-methyltransferase SETMAR [Trichonephila clavipes]|nr:histone-lysine N-methyltransferase SETMAR [Trichonephila clavipes]